MKNRPIRTIIADDHTLFRQGLKMMLEDLEEIDIVADVANGKELIDITGQVNPELVIMDINMPQINGIEASKILLQKNPDLKILVISMYDDLHYYNALIENGVMGFILKDAENSELIQAIHTILNGKPFFSQELLFKLIRNRQAHTQVTLSTREMEILRLICNGYNTHEIASDLFLSERTVENHRASLLDKTKCKNSVALVIFAFRNKLVEMK